MEVAMSGRKWPQTISALGVGIGLGAFLGILFAPKSGEETRGSLLANVKESVDAAMRHGVKLTKSVRETVGRANERLNDAIEAGKQVYREAKNTPSW
jgi:gas vesicle protein